MCRPSLRFRLLAYPLQNFIRHSYVYGGSFALVILGFLWHDSKTLRAEGKLVKKNISEKFRCFYLGCAGALSRPAMPWIIDTEPLEDSDIRAFRDDSVLAVDEGGNFAPIASYSNCGTHSRPGDISKIDSLCPLVHIAFIAGGTMFALLYASRHHRGRYSLARLTNHSTWSSTINVSPQSLSPLTILPDICTKSCAVI